MRKLWISLMAMSLVLVLAATLPAGCSQAAVPAPAARPPAAPASQPLQGASGAAPRAPASSDSTNSSQNQSSGDRMVVRTASMWLVVSDVDDLLSKASELATELGGFVVSSDSQEQNGDRVGKATLRVPSGKLDDAMKRLRGLATKVDRESTTSQDVTEEYIDQDARLRTLRATEDQYLQLMKGASTMDEVMKVQQALQQVRQQIESTQGRLQYLQRSSEMAVINLQASTASAARPMEAEGWDLQAIFFTAVRALVSTVTLIAGLAVWVAVFAPLWIPAVLVIRWWGRRHPHPETPAPPAAPAAQPESA